MKDKFLKYEASFFLLFLFAPTVARAQFLFKDITSSSGIYMVSSDVGDAGAGVVVFDFNGDGWDDIYMAGGSDSDKLYLNMRDGTFKDITPPNLSTHADAHGQSWRIFPRGGIAFDYYND